MRFKEDVEVDIHAGDGNKEGPIEGHSNVNEVTEGGIWSEQPQVYQKEA